MKTAVSLPDALFEAAERVARRLRIPRSRLYALALAEYLERRSAGRVTEALDRVYEVQDSTLDETLARIQAASLALDEW